MLSLEVLRHKSFRDLWLGQAISQFGDAFYYVIFMFMVKQLTGKASMVGFVGAAETLPYLLFSAYGGVLADRIDRRRIMLLSDVISGSVLLLFALVCIFAVKPPIWTIFVAASSLSTIRSMFLPAKSAAIPRLVPEDMLLKANTLSYMTQSYAPMLGLALSASVLGVLYSFARDWFFPTAILVNALSFWASAWFIRKLPTIVPERDDHHEVRHPWTDFKAGIHYVFERPVLRTLLSVGVLFSLFVSPFFVLYVDANEKWFGGKPQNLAWCEFTFFFGLIIGGTLVDKLKVSRAGIAYVWALFVVGVTIGAMAFSPILVLFLTWNFLAGIAVPFADIPMRSYVQIVTEDAFRGRVNSTFTMVQMGITPIGLSLGGVFIAAFGLVNCFFFMGVGMTITALLGLLSKPFREARMPENVKPVVSQAGHRCEAS